MSEEQARLIDQAAKVICDDETPSAPGFAQWEDLTEDGKETYRRSARALDEAGMLWSPLRETIPGETSSSPSARLLEVADVLSAGLPRGTMIGGRGVADAARRLVAERDGCRRSAANAERLIERIKNGELVWDGLEWIEPVVDAEVIDHTDPDQLRHAAAIIEGVGSTDVEGSGPGEFYTSAAILRALAEKLDAKKTVLAQALDAYERVVLAAPDATMTEVHPRAIRAVVELLREGA
ncbi:hypothetical protein SEA_DUMPSTERDUDE_57 [Gordonia phage DumpsterDude]|uniref:Uncharacterized protein n=1 Tax=Gordonia phage DumpsterDude TaxID=2713262 RepID=A0A6G8R0B4_9CAUD|nr:hypothetical protein JZX77_gp57 [Gordonia phage DumpsterDude]QIN93645.1 hypothetical protein SEA_DUMPSTERDUDE_57 [Gordonia phage DumpsterDude]